MARTLVAGQSTGAPYEAALTTTTFTACDAANGNYTPTNGQQVLVFYNSDTNPHTVTVFSAKDAEGRTQDITAFSIAAGAFAHTAKFPIIGWQDSGGNLDFTASDATVKVAVLTVV
jgi:hypothetical protein